MQGGAQRIWTSDGLQGRERSALGKAEEQKELALRRPCSSCCWALCVGSIYLSELNSPVSEVL
jgi:hypothetical protein